jgi:hypothetical protein
VIVAIAVYVWALPAVGCSFLDDIILKQSHPSPDGVFVADWYQLSGGGAVSTSVDRVRLREATEPFRSGSDDIFSALEADVIAIRWISNRELEIAGPVDAPIKRSEPKWRDVNITYVRKAN